MVWSGAGELRAGKGAHHGEGVLAETCNQLSVDGESIPVRERIRETLSVAESHARSWLCFTHPGGNPGANEAKRAQPLRASTHGEEMVAGSGEGLPATPCKNGEGGGAREGRHSSHVPPSDAIAARGTLQQGQGAICVAVPSALGVPVVPDVAVPRR